MLPTKEQVDDILDRIRKAREALRRVQKVLARVAVGLDSLVPLANLLQCRDLTSETCQQLDDLKQLLLDRYSN
jgi:glycerol-3-phosphate O-acyltransferase